MSTLATPQTATGVTTWNIDPVHSVAEFKVKHMMISNVKGQFTRVQGELNLDENDLTKSSIEASIDAASIHTRDEEQDGRWRGGCDGRFDDSWRDSARGVQSGGTNRGR